MNKVYFLILVFFQSVISFAQTWEINLDRAKVKADAESKSIILVFSGSDWCIPCMKLEKNIWNTTEFIEYSKAHFVMVRADFPRKKSNSLTKDQVIENEKLAERYNKQGLFPLVLVLDKDGNILGSTSYKNISPSAYIELLQSFEHKRP